MDLTTREPQVMVGRTVKIATVAFAITVGVHGLDHLRRGLDVVQMPVAMDGHPSDDLDGDRRGAGAS
jgi:hypothetical protein